MQGRETPENASMLDHGDVSSCISGGALPPKASGDSVGAGESLSVDLLISFTCSV